MHVAQTHGLRRIYFDMGGAVVFSLSFQVLIRADIEYQADQTEIRLKYSVFLWVWGSHRPGICMHLCTSRTW